MSGFVHAILVSGERGNDGNVFHTFFLLLLDNVPRDSRDGSFLVGRISGIM